VTTHCAGKSTDEKKPPLRWFFFAHSRITSWLAQQQGQQQRELQTRQERQQELQTRQEQQREQQQLAQQPREQELLLFYRKQPGQQQRSRLPKREICSFLDTRLS
jgi:hypothetical protein